MTPGYLVLAKQVDNCLELRRVVDQGVDPEPPQLRSRAHVGVHRAQIRTNMKRMLDPPNGATGGTINRHVTRQTAEPYGNDPPPCANATRRPGIRSNTPPNTIEQMARLDSAGIPTSHGSQYFCMDDSPAMSHGCTNTHADRLATVLINVSPEALVKSAPTTTFLEEREQRRVAEVQTIDVRPDLDAGESQFFHTAS